MNEAQRRLHEVVERQYAAEGRVRVIILKARQMGLSTYVGGRMFSRVSQRNAKKAMVATHHADSTKALFDMTKRFQEHCPELLRPQSKYSNRRELVFGALDSAYAVATAGSDGIGRGETFTHAHISELAFWPPSSAAANFNGLMQSIPSSDDTEVYIESTANGVSGLFHDQWQSAVRGQSGFIPVFLPWFIQAEYREAAGDDFTRSPAETILADTHGIDDDQLMFRRRKIAQSGLELFRQEYPSTADEAFLTTGRPVFNPDILKEHHERAKEEFPAPVIRDTDWGPTERRALEGSTWLEHPVGDLYVYREHDPEETYYIGADVGAGVNKDWSVAQVQDSKRRQVAMYRAQAEPAYFGEVLHALGGHYNQAKIIVERNNHGILVCFQLAKALGYWNVYTETTVDKLTDIETTQIGFFTSEKSKPLIIDKLRMHLRERAVEINDAITLSEMRSYVVTASGKMEAEKGCHDDAVMALALVNHVNEGTFEPIVNVDTMFVRND